MRNLWISYKNSSGIDSRASVLIAPNGIETTLSNSLTASSSVF